MIQKRGRPRTPFPEWLALTVANPVDYFKGIGFPESPEGIMAEYEEAFAKVTKEGIRPIAYPDARQFLSSLHERGMPAFVVSSHPQEFLLAEADFYGFSPFIAGFTGSARDKSVELVRIVGEQQLPSTSALYVGDMKFDIRAAKKAGMRSAGVSTGYDTHDELSAENPDILAGSLTELMERLSSKGM